MSVRSHALVATIAFLCLPLSLSADEIQKQPQPDAGVLPVKVVRAFPNMRFNRPIVVTHAGDGSDRIFIAEQAGRILVMENDPEVEETSLFADLTDRVVYKDKQNEEGLLGVAFHPKFKQNGEVYLYYTTASAPHTSVVSRFKVNANDAGKLDVDSEQELLRVPQPFWNHNGGTIAFGPDGYLYIALGDGGSANDPNKNGQNVKTILGSILRIDVDRKGEKTAYGIPKDNPFVSGEGLASSVDTTGAAPEIYAFGLRNPWRIAFDEKTGLLWCADVGQNLWEEINIIEKGGNYGWNTREGLHPFDKDPAEPASPTLIDPIWEYHHDIGKSITGGFVYRGEDVPALAGKYLYADYVKGTLYGLDYDEKAKKVRGNYKINGPNLPVMSFGRDEQGEAYFTTTFGLLYTFEPAE